MNKCVHLLLFNVFLLSGCGGDELSTSSKDESASITAALLGGTWTADCSDNSSASTSTKTVLVFSASGDNLTATTTNYSVLNCVADNESSIFRKKLNTLVLGSKTTTSQNQIINKFTASVTSITLNLKARLCLHP